METKLPFHLFAVILLLTFLAMSSDMIAQGLEDFTNCNVRSGYSNGSFVGNNGVNWSYIASRDGNGDANGSGIDLPALMLRRVSDGSKVISDEIPNGIGNLSVKLYKGFTSNNNRQVELFINGISQGRSIPFNDLEEHIFQVNNINISGNIIIEIINVTNNQVIIDDIFWTSFESEGNSGPIIRNIVQDPASNNVTSSDTVSVYADISDVNGVAWATLSWGTESGNLNNIITMIPVVGDSYTTASPIPEQLDGTTIFYQIEATDNHVDPASSLSAEMTYIVNNPLSLLLPYYNPLRNQNDLDGALANGFEFNNSTLETGGGGYIKLGHGSIVSPAINLSAYEDISVIFDIMTYGGSRGQELSISISNDNGATFNVVTTIPVPGDYETISHRIDLNGYNSPHGRLKFAMTGGSNSIRFRELALVPDFQGFIYKNGIWSPSNPNGLTIPTDDLFIVNGAISLNMDTSVRNIAISQVATLKVEKVLTIAGDIMNNGNLIFMSSPTANGELAAVPGTSTISGMITVQRYLMNRASYRILGSSVSTMSSIHDNWQEAAIGKRHNPNPGFGTHISGSLNDQENGFDGTISGVPSMYIFDVNNQSYGPIANTDINTLEIGKGFLMYVKGDRGLDPDNNAVSSKTILRSKGTLHIGEHSQNFETGEYGDFVLFANPYQSTVDIKGVLENSSNLNSNFYYVMDPALGDHGAFVTVDFANGDGVNTSGSNVSRFLQPGQGAMAATAAAGSASIIFNEENKSPGSFTATNRNTGYRRDENAITVQLYTQANFENSGPVHDSFGLLFSDEYDNDLNLDDAIKPLNPFENIGVLHGDGLLSLEKRAMPIGNGSEIFPIYTSGYQSTDYVLKSNLDGLDYFETVLYDRYSNISVPILPGSENIYQFGVDLSEPLSFATDRFEIRILSIIGVHDQKGLNGLKLYPNPVTGDEFFILAPLLDGKEVFITISELSGRKIFTQSTECRDNRIPVPVGSGMSIGVYMVKVQSAGQEMTFKMIRK